MQDTTEKPEENVRKRGGKRRNPTDADPPKERVKRQPRKKLKEIMESSKVLTNEELEPTLTMDTTNDNTIEQPISNTEQIDPPSNQSNTRLNYNNVYLLVFLVLTAIIGAYFLRFK